MIEATSLAFLGAGTLIGVILFLVAIGIAATVFWIIELIDVFRRDFTDPTMKIVWLLVVFFLHLLGAIIYHYVGRSQGTIRT